MINIRTNTKLRLAPLQNWGSLQLVTIRPLQAIVLDAMQLLEPEELVLQNSKNQLLLLNSAEAYIDAVNIANMKKNEVLVQVPRLRSSHLLLPLHCPGQHPTRQVHIQRIG